MKSLTNSLNVWFLLGGARGFHYDRALNDIQTWKAVKAARLAQAARAVKSEEPNVIAKLEKYNAW